MIHIIKTYTYFLERLPQWSICAVSHNVTQIVYRRASLSACPLL